MGNQEVTALLWALTLVLGMPVLIAAAALAAACWSAREPNGQKSNA